jgi:hypothetical protein
LQPMSNGVLQYDSAKTTQEVCGRAAASAFYRRASSGRFAGRLRPARLVSGRSSAFV